MSAGYTVHALRTLAVIGFAAVASVASATVDIAQLRTNCTGVISCTGSQSADVTCCETSMSTLTAWLWGTRKPTESAPVLIDIGPGSSFAAFDCPLAAPPAPHNGHVTLRGSGRDRTRIARFSARDCDKLSIQDLTVADTAFAITWRGSGSSQWSNVGVDVTPGFGFSVGWWDIDMEPATPKAVHYWFGSKIRVHGATGLNAAFLLQSTETWFYGGEIEADLSGLPGGSGFNSYAASVAFAGDLRVFGSAVRSRAGSACAAGTLYGMRVLGNGMFHMHGGIINADGLSTAAGCSAAINAIALEGEDNAQAHTPGTAFQVSANGTGTATRLAKSGSAHLDSPFLWPAAVNPPAIDSLNGADLFVETDCNGSACIAGAGSDTHLMIYNPARCPTPTWSKWFDATSGACRQ